MRAGLGTIAGFYHTDSAGSRDCRLRLKQEEVEAAECVVRISRKPGVGREVVGAQQQGGPCDYDCSAVALCRPAFPPLSADFILLSLGWDCWIWNTELRVSLIYGAAHICEIHSSDMCTRMPRAGDDRLAAQDMNALLIGIAL